MITLHSSFHSSIDPSKHWFAHIHELIGISITSHSQCQTALLLIKDNIRCNIKAGCSIKVCPPTLLNICTCTALRLYRHTSGPAWCCKRRWLDSSTVSTGVHREQTDWLGSFNLRRSKRASGMTNWRERSQWEELGGYKVWEPDDLALISAVIATRFLEFFSFSSNRMAQSLQGSYLSTAYQVRVKWEFLSMSSHMGERRQKFFMSSEDVHLKVISWGSIVV